MKRSVVSRVVSTGAVGYDATRQLLLSQSSKGVESPSRLEGAYALIILAFEEDLDLWPGWSLSLIWCSN